MKARSIAVVFVALTIAVTLFNPVSTIVSDNSGEQAVTNETVNADLDTYVELNGYDIVSNSETVYGYNDTAGSYEELPASDYDLKEGPGEIRINSSSTVVQDGEDVKVSYDYQATDGTTTTVLVLIPMFLALLILGVLAAKVTDLM